MEINGRIIGDGHPAYIIAEMSANHAGSLERALELVHVAKDAGADCVKIQTYTADTMTIDCQSDLFRARLLPTPHNHLCRIIGCGCG